MSTTSQKHRRFTTEPMGDKRVTELPGIGKVLGGRLKENGFDRAYEVMGAYMLHRQNRRMFTSWLKETCGANKKQQEDCYMGLHEYCRNFVR